MTFYMGTGDKLTDQDFARLAKEHQIDEAKLRAVVEVECKGKGFHSSGALVCLYEPHIAYRQTSGKTRTALVKAGLAYSKWKRNYPRSSFSRIDRCTEIAGAEVAALSTSWGLPQMMGFNHKRCGYPSAVEMVEAFAKGEVHQLEAMIRFIKSDSNMHAALKERDWSGFAKRYNGSGYAKNGYHTKLARAYAKWAKIISERPEVVAPIPDDPGPVEPEPPKPTFWQSLVNWLSSLLTARR